MGGCQQALGLEPDLTMLGKIIGGGFPVGAVGGGRELLKIFDPADMKVFHTGTFNANPVTMVAGEVSLQELTAARIEQMRRLREKLQTGLAAIAKKNSLPLSMNHYGSCLNIYFSESAPHASAVREDDELIGKFHIACLNHGLFIAPRGLIALSTVITDDDISAALESADSAMQDVSAESG
jgi:glutamate-1-semialdehyde 2,1-aminomutase